MTQPDSHTSDALQTSDGSIEPLTFLSRIVQGAVAPQSMPSLSLQVASAVAQLGSFLTIRGENGVEHYFAQALTLGCLKPAANDISPLERTLFLFIAYDRRRPQLPRLAAAGSLALQEAAAIHFIQLLRDQNAFQPLYESAGVLDRYGAIARTRRKMERIVLLSRELTGRNFLLPPTTIEELYLRLAQTN